MSDVFKLGWLKVAMMLILGNACLTVTGATFTVDTTANSGSGSLRQAILDANATGGTDTIDFAIPGSPPFTIQPLSALPTVIEPVSIDATTQPGFAGSPVVELCGNAAGPGASGLTVTGGGTIVRGFVINRFSGHGIWLENGGFNTLEGNYVGLNTAGSSALGNGQFGVVVLNSSSNTIGGTTATARNVISGNGNSGIIIQGPSWNNIVQGNLIGSDASGTLAMGNSDNGIYLFNTSTNTVGGTSAGAGNTISGNGLSGVTLGGDAAWNRIQGNLLGTDLTGSFSLGVQQAGINANPGHDNVIGGTNSAARNLVSGNLLSGIILQSGSSGNWIQGNFIGLESTGTSTLSNGQNGILIGNAPGNTVGGTTSGAGNVISGNGLNGVEIVNSGSQSNVIQGNLIGMDVSGTVAVGNADGGVFIDGASSNLIGGTTPVARNVITGNLLSGVGIGGAASGNRVQGNFIGLDVTGLAAPGNDENGVLVNGGINNLIGGTTVGEGNVISGNGFAGVELADGTSANQVSGNLIGTDLSGTNLVGSQLAGFNIRGTSNNVIGGTVPGAGNVIAGHFLQGLRLWDGASANQIHGNFIGTDVTGTLGLGNSSEGVLVQDASNNQIGGTSAGAGNIIAFNWDAGVSVESGTNNLIRANSIFSNWDLGIDLGGDGVGTNDVGDADTGPNFLQNFPVLTTATANEDGSTTISGTLSSKPSQAFTLEFFSSSACHTSGHGEGEVVIGTTNVSTGIGGSNTFVVTFTNTVSAGQVITATATDPFNNTSEFSACVSVVAAPVAPEIVWTVNGEELELSWPTLPAGWRLESQTNAAGIGLTTSWSTLIDPLLRTNISFPIDPSQGSIFYRLVKP